MMRTQRMVLALAVAVAAAPLTAQRTTASAEDVGVLLQTALHREQVEGKVAEAIDLYQQVIAKAGPGDRDVAAQAQLQLARVYEKAGDARAPDAYRVVVRNFADQPTVAAAAEARLVALAPRPTQSGLSPRHRSTDVDLIDAFTPDGVQAFIITTDLADTQLLLRDLSTGHDTVLATRTNEGRPLSGRMSPDGKWVSVGWINYQPRTFGILLVPAEGGELRTLVPQRNVTTIWNVGWSPDGSSILAFIGPETNAAESSPSMLAWVSVADGSVRPIKTLESARVIPQFGAGVRISPDGTRISYTARPPSGGADAYIYTIDLNGQDEQAVVTMAGRNIRAVWTPDAGSIIFSNVTSPQQRDLWTVPVRAGAAAGAPKRVQGNFPGTLIDMTRGGDLYYSLTVQGGPTQFVVETVSGAPRVVETFDGTSGTWSADGRLAFIRQGQQNRLIVRSVATGEERTYQIDQLANVSPRWLPDGRSVIVTTNAGQGQQALLHVDLGSGSTTLLADVQGEGYPRGAGGAISPDGQTLYLPRRAEASGPWTGIDAVDVRNGTTQRSLFFPSPMSRATGLGLAVSPDGQMLAIGAVSTGTDVSLSDARSRILTMRTDGSGLREVYGPFTGAAPADRVRWTPDGQFILFTENSPNGLTTSGVARGVRIMRVPAGGGTAEPVGLDTTSLQGDVPIPRLFAGPLMGNFDISADGARIAFSATVRTTYEFWTLDNVLAVINSR